MKSFSSASFPADQVDVLEEARVAVENDPQALFTNFQWFLYEGRDTVFYTAFSTRSFDKDGVGNLVAEMVSLAPQLTHGFAGAKPGQPFPKHVLDAITSVETVEEFDGYPDKWIGKSQDIYAHEDLPLFRVMVLLRRDGPDAQGRASLIQVRASHAVMEGSDSALMTRSQSAGHGIMSNKENKISLYQRVSTTLRAWMMTVMYLGIALLMAPEEKPFGFRTLAISRHRLRRLANKLGVRQRSLYFALVTYALNGDGKDKNWSKKVIGAAYTMLDTNRTEADDDFFRVRALEAKFQVREDFEEYAREVDHTVDKIEQKDITKFQTMMNAMFGTLRQLNRMFPAIPPKKFWRFNGGIHVVLTLVPPHRTYGSLTNGVIEPIFCGAWHSGVNICTFCPSRDNLAMSFSMEERHIKNVDGIMTLLEEIEARHPDTSAA